MMFTPDGTHVYVSNEHSLTVIDTTNTDACDWGDYFSNAVAVISVPMLRDLLGIGRQYLQRIRARHHAARRTAQAHQKGVVAEDIFRRIAELRPRCSPKLAASSTFRRVKRAILRRPGGRR